MKCKEDALATIPECITEGTPVFIPKFEETESFSEFQLCSGNLIYHVLPKERSKSDSSGGQGHYR
ncbi:hypothetical protein EJB05_09186, partial [Eragrostis curvula]